MFIDAGGAQVTRWITKRKTVSSNTIYQLLLKIRISYNKPHLYPENQRDCQAEGSATYHAWLDKTSAFPVYQVTAQNQTVGLSFKFKRQATALTLSRPIRLHLNTCWFSLQCSFSQRKLYPITVLTMPIEWLYDYPRNFSSRIPFRPVERAAGAELDPRLPPNKAGGRSGPNT
jgi:hypothetical protein